MSGNLYILWDFDGTLGQRLGMWSGALLEILAAEGLDRNVTVENFRQFLGSGFRWHRPEKTYPQCTPPAAWWSELDPIFERAFCEGVGLASDQACRLAKKVRDVFPDSSRWRLFDDTKETLETLTDRGWKHVLLTNHIPELPQILRSLELDGYFTAIFNSAVTGFEKPHRSAFENVLGTLPVPSCVWMVGDNPVADVAGAEGAGIPAILVRKRHASAKRFAEELGGVVGLVEAL